MLAVVDLIMNVVNIYPQQGGLTLLGLIVAHFIVEECCLWLSHQSTS